jgi:hypothetical protein
MHFAASRSFVIRGAAAGFLASAAALNQPPQAGAGDPALVPDFLVAFFFGDFLDFLVAFFFGDFFAAFLAAFFFAAILCGSFPMSARLLLSSVPQGRY